MGSGPGDSVNVLSQRREGELDGLKYADLLYDLPMERATYRVRSDGEVLDRLDLMVDFIPLVQVTKKPPMSTPTAPRSI
ncbi:hypothetical protein DVH02_16230 [Streptomyces corynorhini]|uniref:Uncharacterized protein n=1 Tax=Streptomyces corynorhini TaxID=2282652 RepID=A0A370B658_9ACTN|nr:hypothetical protein DVH02_16230 [Streptomyces corynorhini]